MALHVKLTMPVMSLTSFDYFLLGIPFWSAVSLKINRVFLVIWLPWLADGCWREFQALVTLLRATDLIVQWSANEWKTQMGEELGNKWYEPFWLSVRFCMDRWVHRTVASNQGSSDNGKEMGAIRGLGRCKLPTNLKANFQRKLLVSLLSHIYDFHASSIMLRPFASPICLRSVFHLFSWTLVLRLDYRFELPTFRDVPNSSSIIGSS